MANGDGTIGEQTRVTLRVVVPLVIALVAGLGAWLDMRYQVRSLRTEMFRLSMDRWSRVDDLVYMHEFAAANNLEVVPHTRASVREIIEKHDGEKLKDR